MNAMNVDLPGKLVDFGSVPLGGAFRFPRGETICSAVKTIEGATEYAVVLCGLDPPAPPHFLSLAKELHVFSMPELRFVISHETKDFDMGKGTQFEAGHIFLYPNRAESYLSYLLPNQNERNRWLLDLTTGKSFECPTGTVPKSTSLEEHFKDRPIEITRWALVIERFGKPVTLFTYPGPEPLNFG